MSLEIWQAIPAVNEGDLRPILSTLTDRGLEQQVATDLDLSPADSLSSILHTKTRSFKIGRFVIVNYLRPEAVQARLEDDLTDETDARWFEVANFVLRLTEQRSQGCYGSWRKGFTLGVFGQ